MSPFMNSIPAIIIINFKVKITITIHLKIIDEGIDLIMTSFTLLSF